ncbi:hypothetical protein D3C86_2137900 [compost metagenome]
MDQHYVSDGLVLGDSLGGMGEGGRGNARGCDHGGQEGFHLHGQVPIVIAITIIAIDRIL